MVTKKRSVASLVRRKGFQQFLQLIVKYKYMYAAVVALQLGGTGSSVMLAETIKRLLDGGSGWSRPELYKLLAEIAGFVALGLFCSVMARICNQIVNTNVVYAMRQLVLTKLVGLSLAVHDSQHSSRSNNLMYSELEVFKQFIVFDILKLIALPFSFVAVGVYLLTVHPLLGLVALLVGPMQLLSNLVVKESFKALVARQQEHGNEVFFHMGETLSGMREVKMNRLEASVLSRFRDICERGVKLWVAIERMQAIRDLLRVVPERLGYLLGIGVGTILLVNGEVGPGALVAFITLLDRVSEPFASITGIIGSLQKVSAGAESLLDTMETDSEDMTSGRKLEAVPPVIEFEDVSFAYVEGNPVLRNISFRIEAGQTMALVGPSGGGKSTIIKLLYRTYTPHTGVIRINGVPIQQYSLESLRDSLATVTQEVYLFDGTVRDNIAVGRMDAGDDAIHTAAELSQALDFINDLPDRFETRVGERGIKLSQGQKQRIGIARAIVRKAPILVLDEPTSALDIETESLFQQRLAEWSGNSTKLIIAHRLSTIRNADVVVFLERGQIKETGSPRKLIGDGGRFTQFWEKQAITEFIG